MVFRGPHRICISQSAGCAEMLVEGTTSAADAVDGVKKPMVVRRMAAVEGVRDGRRGESVVKVLFENTNR